MVAPKLFGKIITKYRTVRRIGNGSEITTTKTVHNETALPTDINDKRSISIDSNDRLRTNSASSHEALMESIRQFDGSQNLGKK
jgi:hypothetical protein